jgi:hypothetical protein
VAIASERSGAGEPDRQARSDRTGFRGGHLAHARRVISASPRVINAASAL